MGAGGKGWESGGRMKLEGLETSPPGRSEKARGREEKEEEEEEKEGRGREGRKQQQLLGAP